MPQTRRPLRGGRGFYPRKKAKRMYPRVKAWPILKEAKPLGFVGYKAGMTHAMIIETNQNSRLKGQMISKAVTVLDCPPITVFGFRAYKRTAYGYKTVTDVFAEKFSPRLKRAFPVAKPTATMQNMEQKLGIIFDFALLCHTNPGFKKTPEVFEMELGGTKEEQLAKAKELLGKEIKASELFKAGEHVDVSAVTKGKGFSGPVVRFGVTMLGRKAQQMARHTGSLGTTEPGKIRPQVPAAGQHGFQTRTELNKRILKIADGKDIQPAGGWLRYGKITGEALILEGSVPGPTKRLIRMRLPIRNTKPYVVDFKNISLESKQGA